MNSMIGVKVCVGKGAALGLVPRDYPTSEYIHEYFRLN